MKSHGQRRQRKRLRKLRRTVSLRIPGNLDRDDSTRPTTRAWQGFVRLGGETALCPRKRDPGTACRMACWRRHGVESRIKAATDQFRFNRSRLIQAARSRMLRETAPREPQALTSDRPASHASTYAATSSGHHALRDVPIRAATAQSGRLDNRSDFHASSARDLTHAQRCGFP
jgi:hypothetical protein